MKLPVPCLTRLPPTPLIVPLKVVLAAAPVVNVFAPSATVVEATPDSEPMVSLFSSSNWAAAVLSVTADPSGIRTAALRLQRPRR